MPEIILGSRTIAYTIRYSKRAQRVSFRISPAKGLQVVLPEDYPTQNIDFLLRRRQDWILKHLALAEEVKETIPERHYRHGELLPFLGDAYPLEVSQSTNDKRTSVRHQAGRFWVTLQTDVVPNDFPAATRIALETWYRQQANLYIPSRTYDLAEQHGFTVQKITIRGQKTRWGSCSSNGNLNFNWRLMLAPPGAIDYVIIHELCHLREMNHSAKFWALVEQYCPDYRYWWDWLKIHSHELYL